MFTREFNRLSLRRAVNVAGARKMAVVTWSAQDQSSRSVLHYVTLTALITSLIQRHVVALVRTVCVLFCASLSVCLSVWRLMTRFHKVV